MPLAQLNTLDYGMGWGEWARVSKSLGCRSYGHDLAPELVRAAARYDIEPHTNQLYHFINTEQVLEHIADPAGTVEYLAACLLPGGILKVSVPSTKGVESVLGKLVAGQAFANPELMPIAPVEHLNCFTLRALEGLGWRFGLEPVKPSYRHRYAFLRRRRTLGTSPTHAAKEIARPLVQWRNPRNLYLWLRRAIS